MCTSPGAGPGTALFHAILLQVGTVVMPGHLFEDNPFDEGTTLSSLTRDRIHALAVKAGSPNYWIPRAFPSSL